MSSLLLFKKTESLSRGAEPNIFQFANTSRKEGYFNDVTIETNDKSIPANRLVLSCCCPYFEKMFKCNLKESTSDVVKIQGVNGKALSLLVEFIYTGNIEINNENVLDLLAAADYLQLDEASRYCFEFLQSIVTTDTCCEILLTVNTYQHENLQQEILKFIIANFKNVKHKDSLSKKDLIYFLSNLDQCQTNSVCIYETIVEWTKQDLETRQKDFLDLFRLLDFNSLTSQFLQNVVLKEELMNGNLACSNFLMKKMVHVSVNASIKAAKRTKIISFGGVNTPRKMMEVFNMLDEPEISYPDLPQNCKSVLVDHSSQTLYFYGNPSAQILRIKINGSRFQWKFPPYVKQMDASTIYQHNLVAIGSKTEHNHSVMFYLQPLNEWLNGPPLKLPPRSGCALLSHNSTLYVLGGQWKQAVFSSVEKTRCKLQKYDYFDNLCHGECLSSKEKKKLKFTMCRYCTDMFEDMNFSEFKLRSSTCENMEEDEGVLSIRSVGSWEYSQPMQIPRTCFVAISHNNRIYAIGGRSNDTEATETMEAYDRQQNTWTYKSAMKYGRREHAACVLGGKIYVVGGRDCSGEAVKAIECYDVSEDSWRVVGETDDELFGHSVAAF